ncbi:hypothetical protein [Hyalangium rubrum]|uniref:Superoxide dismutase copper/zinc binding domain-containing protein n=1 Tax=Hyalangium rubrum TaxID=3103134 RepID=A0ABU5H0J8_9BACT|nr:hypothetical protein [Hyalangium sp. s54d21]MDY7226627.1 hypothetical protein [Hyalangium sp. s54d21]
MRRVWMMALAFTGLVACGENATLEVPIQAVGDSGITGSLTVEEIPGKSGFGEVRFGFTVSDTGTRQVIGFVHEGRCASLGMHEHREGFEPDGYPRQRAYIREGHKGHAERIGSFQGSHAFAVHERITDIEDASGAVLACGDI